MNNSIKILLDKEVVIILASNLLFLNSFWKPKIKFKLLKLVFVKYCLISLIYQFFFVKN